jgi:hypothetical protein
LEQLAPEQFQAMLDQAPVPPIFQDVPDYRAEPSPAYGLLPSVFRGAGMSDLPDPAQVATVETPALILAWPTDPSHPTATASRLAELLSGSVLHVSDTSADVRTWADRAARFFASH